VSASELVDRDDRLDVVSARPYPVAIDDPIRFPPRWELTCKRLLDVVAALFFLVVLSPLLALVAIAIKLTTPGPVLFRQERVGLDGVVFEVMKFRTMRDGALEELLADQESRARYQANDFKLAPDDPAITTVGRVLRRTSLDELPQLFNVLLGHMSIVGVRPLLAEEVALRPRADQALYRTARPGMTGLWQVEGRSTVRDDERIRLDRLYLAQRSLGNDARILLRTPAAVLRTSHAH
jgi:lipopolysaccharide/colanic/teichoic acid biosynthesis glycosyltransferase